jgi:hypothetical protein
MDHSCEGCGKRFQARRGAKTCSATCRKRVSDRLKAVGGTTAPPGNVGPAPTPQAQPELVAAVAAELEAAGRLDTALGRQALRLAQRMHSEFDTGSAIAALSKELRATMAEALKDATPVADPLDELAARRSRKAAGA